MINSKKELNFYIAADCMMNLGKFKLSIKDRIIDLFFLKYQIRYLKLLRKCQYYKYSNVLFNRIRYAYFYYRLTRLSVKLGYSIGVDTLGYGVTLPHYGTIVIGNSNRIGNFAVLHTSTCITDNGKIIGNALYLSTGVKITSKVILGDNISIGANSLVNKSFIEGNCMIAGAPAIKKKEAVAWYVRDGEIFFNRVMAIEKLKDSLNFKK